MYRWESNKGSKVGSSRVDVSYSASSSRSRKYAELKPGPGRIMLQLCQKEETA